MRSYEVMLAINPQLEDEELDSLLTKFKKLITDAKGEITKTNKWGKRKLAYEIKDFTEANYVVLNFNVDEKIILELERVVKLEERVIRYLLTLQHEGKSQNKNS
ncbi:30S ribosomal protein S6 [Candidatus Woesearchaeota archaeon B3_Woes]|nr:MAG: 30S ribosomal protein S6 [Candidatus Woesearchaeota archaeon B3_Woes]